MDRKKFIKDNSADIQTAFSDFFKKDVLKGRPPLLADISHRTYPYTDLVSAYTAGVLAAVRLVDKDEKDET